MARPDPALLTRVGPLDDPLGLDGSRGFGYAVGVDSFRQQVGAALTALRTARGLSDVEVARRCRLTPKELAQYEAGERGMQSDTLGRFLDAMGADLRDLHQALTGTATASRRTGQGSLIGNSAALHQALGLMRRRRGLNLSDVGDRIGVRKATVSSWESGKAVRLKTLERIFEVLNADFFELHVSLVLARLLQLWTGEEADAQVLALVDMLSPVHDPGDAGSRATLAAIREQLAALAGSLDD